MAAQLPPFASLQFVDSRGYLTIAATQFLANLQNLVEGGGTVLGPGTTVDPALTSADDDASAYAAGVPRWGLYMRDDVLQIQRSFG